MDERWVVAGHRLCRPVAGGGTLFVTLGGDDPDDLAQPCDLELVQAGLRWSGTAATPTHLGQILDRWRTTGEASGGAWLAIPDLVVVPHPTIDAIHAAVAALITENAVPDVLIRLGPEDPEDERLSVVFTTWPDEDELLAELWLGALYVGQVRQRPGGLMTDLYAVEGIPLADLEDALAAIRDRLGS